MRRGRQIIEYMRRGRQIIKLGRAEPRPTHHIVQNGTTTTKYTQIQTQNSE